MKKRIGTDPLGPIDVNRDDDYLMWVNQGLNMKDTMVEQVELWQKLNVFIRT